VFTLALTRVHQSVVGLNDERDVGNQFTAWVPASDSVGAMASWHLIGGWSGRVHGPLSAAVEGFYKDYDGLSVPVFEAFPSFTTALQSADGRAFGADVRVELRDHALSEKVRLSGSASYALSNVTYTAAGFEYNPAHERRHQFDLVARLDIGEIGLTAVWKHGTGLPFTKSAGMDVWFPYEPGQDVSRQPGVTRVLYQEPFQGRQPTYERIDVWLERVVSKRRVTATIRAGVVNVLNRENLFYFDLFTLRRVDQLPFTPSIGFKIEFR